LTVYFWLKSLYKYGKIVLELIMCSWGYLTMTFNARGDSCVFCFESLLKLNRQNVFNKESPPTQDKCMMIGMVKNK